MNPLPHPQPHDVPDEQPRCLTMNSNHQLESPVDSSEDTREEEARLAHRRRMRCAQRTAAAAVSCLQASR